MNSPAANAGPAAELASRLHATPDIYPQKLDLVRGAVLLIAFDANAYRAASFLDDRILGPATRGAWVHGARASEAAARVTEPRPLHFVFHSGHVGSTLVSRLLDESGVALGLREPLPLRTLAETQDVLGRPEALLSEPHFDGALATFARLWSRGYADTRAVVVKATSTTGRLAPRLLARLPAARAIYLNLRAEPYLATLLAGPNSVYDLRGHGAERVRRLAARCGGTFPPALGALHALSPGELAALGWLAESCSLADAVAAHGERVLPVDFDAFLADVGGTMARIVAQLALPVAPEWLASVARSPSLTRYSKAPEHAYGPEARAAALAEARTVHAAEIRRGLAWLDCAARADARLADVVARGLG